jgi:diguanylate cyclase (GGDEF)-like protein
VDQKYVAKPIKVLVLETDPDVTSLFQRILTKEELFEPVFADRLDNALELIRYQTLNQKAFDILLVNLFLPDSAGLDTFLQVYGMVPDAPIVALVPQHEQALAISAIREGAQDCLFQGEVDEKLLVRSLRFAIERHRTWAILQHLCLTDDLTGLLNRRGFLSMARQQVKIAQRESWKMLLLFADLDGLKKINDNFGHPRGDDALRTVAEILRETFRTSDLVARLGGDEFIILAPNVSSGGDGAIIQRLEETIGRHNARLSCYQLSLSWGFAYFDPHQHGSLDDVIVQADQALYRHKRQKRADSP